MIHNGKLEICNVQAFLYLERESRMENEMDTRLRAGLSGLRFRKITGRALGAL